MTDHSNSVMIALLPTYNSWSRIDHPHLTLVYAGELNGLDPTTYNELGKDVFDLSRSFKPLTLNVLGIETFGDGDEKVDVFIFDQPPELLEMREKVESWNASSYAFRPHGTIGPVGSVAGELPNRLIFNRIELRWGNTGFTVQLG
jgi:2'-5' RNA ligase